MKSCEIRLVIVSKTFLKLAFSPFSFLLALIACDCGFGEYTLKNMELNILHSEIKWKIVAKSWHIFILKLKTINTLLVMPRMEFIFSTAKWAL